MSRWYRISLSLAAKCQLGFAVAVILIIGAALFVPYRWMDKLVEQSKLELAHAEAQQVLARHFRPIDDVAVGPGAPPLALGSDEKKTLRLARWQEIEGKWSRKRFGERPKQLVRVGGGSDDEEVDASHSLASQPITQWIRLPGALGIGGGIDDATMGDMDKSMGGGEVSGGEDKKGRFAYPGDVFERKGISKFLNDRNRRDKFSLVPEGHAVGKSKDEPGGFIGGLEATLSRGQVGRYLLAVRADDGCLAGGCHSRTIGDGVDEGDSATGPPAFSDGQLVGVISVTVPKGQTGITLLLNRIFIIVGGLLAGILAVVVFYLITQRFILRPVRRLRDAADKLVVPAEQGQAASTDMKESWQEVMEITETIKTRDEFQQLAQAFHHMLGRLKVAHDRLQESNRALDLQLGELEAKNLALYESNKLKSEFLANVSHELRTPLNAIIGFAEILKDRAAGSDDERGSHYASNVLESGRMLLLLINDLLHLAKIEAGKMELHWGKCSVGDLADALLNYTRPLAQEKHLVVELTVDDDIGLIETDSGKLQQVLFNLLSNAIKFTPNHGIIDISICLVDDDHVQFEISDTGPGIPAEDRDKIFEKFRQLDGSVTREHEGTGLGLAIVKELITMLGGSITVGQRENGTGAVFTVLLPTRPVDTIAVMEDDV